MSKPLVIALGAWVVGAALAFLLLDPVIAAFLVILGAAVVPVVQAAATWDQAPTFEERELARARRRAAQRERDKGKRAAEKARFEARKARKAS